MSIADAAIAGAATADVSIADAAIADAAITDVSIADAAVANVSITVHFLSSAFSFLFSSFFCCLPSM